MTINDFATGIYSKASLEEAARNFYAGGYRAEDFDDLMLLARDNRESEQEKLRSEGYDVEITDELDAQAVRYICDVLAEIAKEEEEEEE